MKNRKPKPDALARNVSLEERARASTVFSNRVWAEIARKLRLSNRELEIVRGIFDDQTEAAIADDLGISPHTVHTHVERLHRKLVVQDRAAMIVRIVTEFLRMTAAPDGHLPPICSKRTAGLCHLRD